MLCNWHARSTLFIFLNGDFHVMRSRRTPSPRRRGHHHYPPGYHHDIGFSDTVSNVVEIVKHEHQRHGRPHRGPHQYHQHGRYRLRLVLHSPLLYPSACVYSEQSLFVFLKLCRYILKVNDPSHSCCFYFVSFQQIRCILGGLKPSPS